MKNLLILFSLLLCVSVNAQTESSPRFAGFNVQPQQPTQNVNVNTTQRVYTTEPVQVNTYNPIEQVNENLRQTNQQMNQGVIYNNVRLQHPVVDPTPQSNIRMVYIVR